MFRRIGVLTIVLFATFLASNAWACVKVTAQPGQEEAIADDTIWFHGTGLGNCSSVYVNVTAGDSPTEIAVKIRDAMNDADCCATWVGPLNNCTCSMDACQPNWTVDYDENNGYTITTPTSCS